MTETDAALLATIAANVRAIHHYGDPPDVRLQGRVDGDVEDIIDNVRALVERQAARLARLEQASVKLALPYEALRMDDGSRKWIAPEIWKLIVEATEAIRAALREDV